MLRVLALLLPPTILLAVRPSSESDLDVAQVTSSWSPSNYFGKHSDKMQEANLIFQGDDGNANDALLSEALELMDVRDVQYQGSSFDAEDVDIFMEVIKYFAVRQKNTHYRMTSNEFDTMKRMVSFFSTADGLEDTTWLVQALRLFDEDQDGHFHSSELQAFNNTIPYFAGTDEMIEAKEFDGLKKTTAILGDFAQLEEILERFDPEDDKILDEDQMQAILVVVDHFRKGEAKLRDTNFQKMKEGFESFFGEKYKNELAPKFIAVSTYFEEQDAGFEKMKRAVNAFLGATDQYHGAATDLLLTALNIADARENKEKYVTPYKALSAEGLERFMRFLGYFAGDGQNNIVGLRYKMKQMQKVASTIRGFSRGKFSTSPSAQQLESAMEMLSRFDVNSDDHLDDVELCSFMVVLKYFSPTLTYDEEGFKREVPEKLTRDRMLELEQRRRKQGDTNRCETEAVHPALSMMKRRGSLPISRRDLALELMSGAD